MIPNIFSSIGYAINASNRILALLNEPDLEKYVETTTPLLDDSEGKSNGLGCVHSDVMVLLEDASFAWLKNNDVDESKEPIVPEASCAIAMTDAPVLYPEETQLTRKEHSVYTALEQVAGDVCVIEESIGVGINRSIDTLRSLSLRIKRAQLVAVVGPVGCGKSSLLSALLGEMMCLGGTVRVCGSIAYHSQQPWILNASIRENICFGRPCDDAKLSTVLTSASLMADLQTLPAGLDTEIGEKGINLSGGQKARVSLARTLYSGADILLLDDPLSALDAHTCEEVFHRGIQAMVREQGKTVILVTHQVHFLPDCDCIAVLGRSGELTSFGRYDELSNACLSELLHVSSESSSSGTRGVKSSDRAAADEGYPIDDKESSSSHHVRSGSSSVRAEVDSAQAQVEQQKGPRDKYDGATLIEDEDRKTVSVYWWYFKCGGLWRCFVIVLLAGIGRAIAMLSTFYLSSWGAANVKDRESHEQQHHSQQDRNMSYLNTYAGICLVGVAFLTLRTYTATVHGVTAGGVFHGTMLRRVLAAPMGKTDS